MPNSKSSAPSAADRPKATAQQQQSQPQQPDPKAVRSTAGTPVPPSTETPPSPGPSGLRPRSAADNWQQAVGAVTAHKTNEKVLQGAALRGALSAMSEPEVKFDSNKKRIKVTTQVYGILHQASKELQEAQALLLCPTPGDSNRQSLAVVPQEQQRKSLDWGRFELLGKLRASPPITTSTPEQEEEYDEWAESPKEGWNTIVKKRRAAQSQEARRRQQAARMIQANWRCHRLRKAKDAAAALDTLANMAAASAAAAQEALAATMEPGGWSDSSGDGGVDGVGAATQASGFKFATVALAERRARRVALQQRKQQAQAEAAAGADGADADDTTPSAGDPTEEELQAGAWELSLRDLNSNPQVAAPAELPSSSHKRHSLMQAAGGAAGGAGGSAGCHVLKGRASVVCSNISRRSSSVAAHPAADQASCTVAEALEGAARGAVSSTEPAGAGAKAAGAGTEPAGAGAEAAEAQTVLAPALSTAAQSPPATRGTTAGSVRAPSAAVQAAAGAAPTTTDAAAGAAPTSTGAEAGAAPTVTGAAAGAAPASPPEAGLTEDLPSPYTSRTTQGSRPSRRLSVLLPAEAAAAAAAADDLSPAADHYYTPGSRLHPPIGVDPIGSVGREPCDPYAQEGFEDPWQLRQQQQQEDNNLLPNHHQQQQQEDNNLLPNHHHQQQQEDNNLLPNHHQQQPHQRGRRSSVLGSISGSIGHLLQHAVGMLFGSIAGSQSQADDSSTCTTSSRSGAGAAQAPYHAATGSSSSSPAVPVTAAVSKAPGLGGSSCSSNNQPSIGKGLEAADSAARGHSQGRVVNSSGASHATSHAASSTNRSGNCTGNTSGDRSGDKGGGSDGSSSGNSSGNSSGSQGTWLGSLWGSLSGAAGKLVTGEATQQKQQQPQQQPQPQEQLQVDSTHCIDRSQQHNQPSAAAVCAVQGKLAALPLKTTAAAPEATPRIQGMSRSRTAAEQLPVQVSDQPHRKDKVGQTAPSPNFPAAAGLLADSASTQWLAPLPQASKLGGPLAEPQVIPGSPGVQAQGPLRPISSGVRNAVTAASSTGRVLGGAQQDSSSNCSPSVSPGPTLMVQRGASNNSLGAVAQAGSRALRQHSEPVPSPTAAHSLGSLMVAALGQQPKQQQQQQQQHKLQLPSATPAAAAAIADVSTQRAAFGGHQVLQQQVRHGQKAVAAAAAIAPLVVGASRQQQQQLQTGPAVKQSKAQVPAPAPLTAQVAVAAGVVSTSQLVPVRVDLLSPVSSSQQLGLVSNPLGPVSNPLGPVSKPLGLVSSPTSSVAKLHQPSWSSKDTPGTHPAAKQELPALLHATIAPGKSASKPHPLQLAATNSSKGLGGVSGSSSVSSTPTASPGRAAVHGTAGVTHRVTPGLFAGAVSSLPVLRGVASGAAAGGVGAADSLSRKPGGSLH